MRNQQKVVTFLRDIGIGIELGDVPGKSFVDFVHIKDGGLIYSNNACVSALLQEAGHLALIPVIYRHLCTGDMDKSLERIWRLAQANGEVEPNSPTYRALIQASDPEATAWAFAAGKAIGLDDEETIRDEEYEGTGADIRDALSVGRYLGVNGLRAAGMIGSVKAFPKLGRWLQP